MHLLRYLLWPFGLLWMLILWVRHRLFDAGILPSRKGAIPTLVVGNLELGGTGKSQLILRLIELLKDQLKIAVLSRGYRRKTSGFVEVNSDSKASKVGDEPLMFKKRFPDVTVCCDEDRLHGIESIKAKFPETQLVILDDAFQHRKLQPDMSLLVTDSGNPFWKNFIVPLGTLRDLRSRAKSATRIVIVNHDHPVPSGHPSFPGGELANGSFPNKSGWPQAGGVFASISFGGISAFDGSTEIPNQFFLLSGIARPERFEKLASQHVELVGKKAYADHHEYISEDMRAVLSNLDKFEASSTGILTTEKDAARLTEDRLNELAPFKMYVLRTELKLEDEVAITQEILKHVLGRD